jgi:aspartyl-tRNA(Asn)/glutamyl-tRNA(Gln) amidotransferase subunit A
VKPTRGLVSNFGIVPVSAALDVAGPIARTVNDAEILLTAVTSEVAHETGPSRDISGLIVGIPAEQPALRVQEDVRAAYELAQTELDAAGCSLEEIALPDLFLTRETMWTIASADAAEYHRRYLQDRALEYSDEVRANLLRGALIPAVDYIRAQRIRERLTQQMNNVFAKVDVLLMPSVAMAHYGRGQKEIRIGGIDESMLEAIMRFTPLSNLTGHPAVVVPVMKDQAAPPVTIQFIGRHLEERLLFEVARIVELAHRTIPSDSPCG